MGLIRFLLAAAVVIWHSQSWGQGDVPRLLFFRPLNPYYAVQAFFLISGFYMELIWRKYAPAGKLLFYINRYSRLMVSYSIICGITILLCFIFPANPLPAIQFHSSSFGEMAYLDFTIAGLVGMDTVELVSPDWSHAFPIPQAWSLGAELWFYLLVLVRAPPAEGS